MAIKDVDLAYAAGLIDGEGCICLSRWHKKNIHGELDHGWAYTLSVTVQMTTPQEPAFMYDVFNKEFGGLYKVYQKRNSNTKPVFHWRISCSSCAPFLKSLLPYLLGKKPQALAAIEYAEWIANHPAHGKRGRSTEEHKYQEEMWVRIKGLKQNNRVYDS